MQIGYTLFLCITQQHMSRKIPILHHWNQVWDACKLSFRRIFDAFLCVDCQEFVLLDAAEECYMSEMTCYILRFSWAAWTSRLRPTWPSTRKPWERWAFTRQWTMEFCCQCPWTSQSSWQASSPTRLCKRKTSWSRSASCLFLWSDVECCVFQSLLFYLSKWIRMLKNI